MGDPPDPVAHVAARRDVPVPDADDRRPPARDLISGPSLVSGPRLLQERTLPRVSSRCRSLPLRRSPGRRRQGPPGRRSDYTRKPSKGAARKMTGGDLAPYVGAWVEEEAALAGLTAAMEFLNDLDSRGPCVLAWPGVLAWLQVLD
jgi:hypothetical protein